MLFSQFKNIRKCLLLLLFTVGYVISFYAQPDAYFNCGAFNTPQDQPFLETYLAIAGNSLASKKIGASLQNSISYTFTAYKDSTMIKAAKYNLTGPAYTDSLKAPVLIDNQRYGLANGMYTLQLAIADNYNPAAKPVIIKEVVNMAFKSTELEGSSIELLDSYKKALVPGAMTKSGLDLVPYTVTYFPEFKNELAFYFEAYNTDTALGRNQQFLYNYYIETANNFTRLSSYGAFKKQATAKVNPLLGKFDISKLGTGNYNLVIEIKDANNVTHLQKKLFFQRLNNKVDVTALQKSSENKNIAEYFGNCNNVDTLKMFVECLWPIADGIDKERIINHALKKDPETMKKYIIDFWQRRAADTANPVKLWANYYKDVQQVMVLFKCGKQKGYYTERGRVYLQYGPPNQRSRQPNEPNTYPYEIWQYYRLNDRSNGQFFTNRKFVFVSKNLGDDCYNLVHSDTRGEINNPRWQYEVMRTSNKNISNSDDTPPAGSQFNQFNELYSNPR